MPVRRERPRAKSPCPQCKGKLYVVRRRWLLGRMRASTLVLCHTCNGSGTTAPNRI